MSCIKHEWKFEHTFFEHVGGGTGMREMAFVICVHCGKVKKVEVEREPEK